MRIGTCSGMRLGVLVAAECKADFLVDCLKERSFKVTWLMSSVNAIVTDAGI
jgi:hypothetical protein